MNIFKNSFRTYFLLVSLFFLGSHNAQINHIVNTVGNTFSPSNISISLGDTVTWINGGGFHNVNATLATYPNNPEGFGNNVSSGWTFTMFLRSLAYTITNVIHILEWVWLVQWMYKQIIQCWVLGK